MAKKSKTKKARKKIPSKEKQKVTRILLVLLIACAAIGVIVFACWAAVRILFTENDHFVIRRLELNGLAKTRSGVMADYLKITLNQDNLFNLNLADIKRKIEGISYIKNAGVYRVLPDTLKINITQRIPIAYLFKYGSKWVVDEDGVVMDRRYCMDLKYTLPVIKGLHQRTVSAGEKISEVAPAVKLIKLTTYEFHGIRISSISLENTNKIVFLMTNKRRGYNVSIPRNNFKNMLHVLREALKEKQGRHKSTVNLTYKGQVIFR